MKVSALQGVLSRIQQIAGDVEVVIKAAEDGVSEAITDLEIHLDPNDAAAPGTVTAQLGPAPAAPEPEAAPADPAPDAPADPSL